MNNDIDIVIPWVDDSDPKWKEQLNSVIAETEAECDSISNVRFESWDNLTYWFRAIENCMPWVRKIFFVTCGQIPEFIDVSNPKLAIVNHTDYIPAEYLPTFNSNTIEMNYHRIDDLSENFILFNDDFFPLWEIDEEYYFKENKICDEAVENIITTAAFGPVSNMARYTQINNMFIINKHFKKREVQAKHPEQWFNECYGDRLERTRSLIFWNDFPGFYDPHLPSAMKKSTLKRIWEMEEEHLDKASRNKLRAYNDVTQYLIRYWQICEGDFWPRKTLGKVFFVDINNYKEVADAIRCKDYQMISINECATPDEFEIIKAEINSSFEELFPNKSSFEK
jgi:hypothetical protein